MLCYIRDTEIGQYILTGIYIALCVCVCVCIDKVLEPVNDDDIPSTLIQRIKEEK